MVMMNDLELLMPLATDLLGLIWDIRCQLVCLDKILPPSIIYIDIIISPNAVFGDIMVSASPPRPPSRVDPDDVNTLTRKIFSGSLSNFI